MLPDLAVYGKSLGGGLPLAAVVGDPEIMALASVEAWQNDPRGVFFSGTLFGNPMACAAGRAFLQALREPGAFPPFLARAEALKAGLTQILGKHGVNAHIVGEGPMWRLYFGDPGQIHDVRATSDKDRQRAFDLGLLDSGIFCAARRRALFLHGPHGRRRRDGPAGGGPDRLAALGPSSAWRSRLALISAEPSRISLRWTSKPATCARRNR